MTEHEVLEEHAQVQEALETPESVPSPTTAECVQVDEEEVETTTVSVKQEDAE